MAWTVAMLTGAMRVSDHPSVSVSVVVRVYLRAALQSLDRDSLLRRDFPAKVMVLYVIAMALFPTVSAREVLRRLVAFGGSSRNLLDEARNREAFGVPADGAAASFRCGSSPSGSRAALRR